MKFKRDNYLWVLSLMAAGLLSSFLGQSIFIPTENTNATSDTSDLTVSAKVAETISLSTEGADEYGNLVIEATGSSAPDTGTITVKVSTNDPEGYSLYITTDKADTTLSQNGITEKIQALEGETAEADFPDNHWGYAIDGASTYHPVQPNTENPAEYPDVISTAIPAKTHPGISANDPTTVTIGAKVSGDFPSGEYSNTVVFTAIPNAQIP